MEKALLSCGGSVYKQNIFTVALMTIINKRYCYDGWLCAVEKINLFILPPAKFVLKHSTSICLPQIRKKCNFKYINYNESL